jgi:toxin CcdB
LVALRQFDIFPNPDARGRATHPFFIVLQSDRVSGIRTRVVAPLVRSEKLKSRERLLPEVRIAGQRYVISMPDLGAVPVHLLPPAIENLERDRERIVGAIDVLFTGI